MNQKVKRYIEILLGTAGCEFENRDFDSAWKRLELAHILSQPFARQHVRVHWQMLKFASRSGDLREIFGQFLRLLVAAPGSWTGKYPVGNTGRSNISMFQELEVSKKIADKIAELKDENNRSSGMNNGVLKAVLFLFVVASADYAFAHGGGGVEAPKEKPKAEAIRSTPVQPDALDENDLIKFSAKKDLPQDVVTIYCKLSEFTPCRGILVSLHNLAGKKIAVASTGTTGTAAFQGLATDATYIAKIESEKYKGEVGVRSGKAWPLMGERR